MTVSGRGKSRHGNKLQVRVSDQLSSKPEWLFKVVVTFGSNVIILKRLLLVEDFALTFPYLISALLSYNTIGVFSHTGTRYLCQLGTFF